MNDETERDFLVYCSYEEWCQGWEDASGYFLVRAFSFDHAVRKLSDYINKSGRMRIPSDFVNCTVE